MRVAAAWRPPRMRARLPGLALRAAVACARLRADARMVGALALDWTGAWVSARLEAVFPGMGRASADEGPCCGRSRETPGNSLFGRRRWARLTVRRRDRMMAGCLSCDAFCCACCLRPAPRS